MVGSTLELHGWAASQVRDVTVKGTVEGAGISQETEATATVTDLAPAPTAQPTATTEPTRTAEPTAQPTRTATATAAPTATRTATAQPTQTATPTRTAEPTRTATPTPSATSTTPTPTAPATTKAPASTSATLDEDFSTWPSGSQFNANRTMQVNGDWMGTDNNMLYRSNVSIANGIATMTSRGNQQSGAELQSTKDKPLGTGYYESRMKMSDVPGILSGIFFISEDYQAPEVDIEVRSRDNGANGRHSAFFTVRQAGQDPLYKEVHLDFDPAAGHHTYGFAVSSTTVTFYIDGKQAHQWTGLQPNLGGAKPLSGYLMTNSWAKNEEWVGPMPTQDTHTEIDHLRYWAGATAPQA